MKLSLLAAVAVLALLFASAGAQETKTGLSKKPAPKTISALEADKFLNQTVLVTGKVAQVTVREKLVFVNLEKRFPNTPLTCVIFARNTNQFGDVKGLGGKQVEVQGKIEEYNNKPQIILNSTNQLKIVANAPARSEAK